MSLTNSRFIPQRMFWPAVLREWDVPESQEQTRTNWQCVPSKRKVESWRWIFPLCWEWMVTHRNNQRQRLQSLILLVGGKHHHIFWHHTPNPFLKAFSDRRWWQINSFFCHNTFHNRYFRTNSDEKPQKKNPPTCFFSYYLKSVNSKSRSLFFPHKYGFEKLLSLWEWEFTHNKQALFQST